MSHTPNCEKLIQLMESLDDGATGFLPFGVIKAMLTECGGETMKADEFELIAGDMNQDGMFPYRWYFQEILCNTNGVGHHQHWLKPK